MKDMIVPSHLGRRWVVRIAYLLIWTAVGLAFACQLYLTQSRIGNAVTWRFALGRALADWYVFAILALPALWLARRYRLERRFWRRNLAIHCAAGLGFSFCWMVVRAGLETFQGRGLAGSASFEAALEHALVATFFFNLMIYAMLLSVSHAVDYYRQSHEREVRSAELENRLAQARLQALRMQLNPHFLFNTLHAISALLHKDAEAADRMISRLSELLRYALESTGAQEVSLERELNFLERYLEIEQVRFGDRLSVRKQIDPPTLRAKVPNLILQPLVENAIRHGVEPHARPGRIELLARRDNGQLVLEVRDNGDGLEAGGSAGSGIGLANTRARLEQLYGEGQRLVLVDRIGGGLSVRVILPFRLEGGEGIEERIR